MKKIINHAGKNQLRFLLVVVMTLLNFLSAIAQKPMTQAEMDKMEKDLMRMMDSMKKDPAMKRMIEQAERAELEPVDTIRRRRPRNSLPPMNAALVKKLQKDSLSHTGYILYLKKLYDELQAKLPPDHKRNVANINPEWQKSPVKLSQLSVLGWYNGATMESTLLAAKAANLNPGNGLDANNLCAMLTMGGVPDRAIPVLQYLLKQDPKNPMLLNNLAQAYAALGATDIAKSYIARCLAVAPRHPEANVMAAQIAALAGDKNTAIAYCEKSLEGGYTASAHSLYYSLKPPKKKLSERLAKVDLPDAFNVYKFELPAQQLLIDEMDKTVKNHTQFREDIDDAQRILEQWIDPLEKKGEAIMKSRTSELQRDPMSYVRNPGKFKRPLTLLGMRVSADFSLVDFNDGLDEKVNAKLKELHDAYARVVGSIEQEYAAKMSKYECGEGKGSGCAMLDQLSKERCQKIDAATHQYLRGKAEARVDWQTKKKNIALKMFFLRSKWSYIAAPEENMAKAAYYKAASEYLTELRKIAVHDGQYYSYCNPTDYSAKAKRNALNMNGAAECPFELEIPMVIGKLGLNCEEASFGISAGASFKFTQNFATKQSTLNVGISLGFEKGIELGGAEAKAGAHIGETLFITFDQSGSVTDAGMRFGAGLSAGYGVKANIKLDGAGEIMADQGADMSRSFGEKKASIGYSFGINSGFGFDEGPLKKLLDPEPEKQVNPKVPIYKGKK